MYDLERKMEHEPADTMQDQESDVADGTQWTDAADHQEVVTVGDRMHYKGYIGTIKYDSDRDDWHGKIINVSDLVLYDDNSKTREELKAAFKDMADWCIEDNVRPTKPASSVREHLSRKWHQVKEANNWGLPT